MRYFYKTVISSKLDDELLVDLKEALEERKLVLELQEPLDNGFFYEKWEEKYDELDNLIDELDEVIEETDLDKKKKLFEEFKESVIGYQFEYGGLKRLKIY